MHNFYYLNVRIQPKSAKADSCCGALYVASTFEAGTVCPTKGRPEQYDTVPVAHRLFSSALRMLSIQGTALIEIVLLIKAAFDDNFPPFPQGGKWEEVYEEVAAREMEILNTLTNGQALEEHMEEFYLAVCMLYEGWSGMVRILPGVSMYPNMAGILEYRAVYSSYLGFKLLKQ